MNPEEGELRPQLLDRFALCVEISGIADPEARVQIVERYVEFEADPEAFHAAWEPQERALSERIARARHMLPQVRYEHRDLYSIASLTSSFQVDGHRADIVILKAALAHAALQGRPEVQEEDILRAAELALPHRLKRQPFQETAEELAHLDQKLTELLQESEHGTETIVRKGQALATQEKKTG